MAVHTGSLIEFLMKHKMASRGNKPLPDTAVLNDVRKQTLLLPYAWQNGCTLVKSLKRHLKKTLIAIKCKGRYFLHRRCVFIKRVPIPAWSDYHHQNQRKNVNQLLRGGGSCHWISIILDIHQCQQSFNHHTLLHRQQIIMWVPQIIESSYLFNSQFH